MTWSYLFVLAPSLFASTHATWTLTQPGTSGVSAMQMTVVGQNSVMMIDKLESNPLLTKSGTRALGSIYSLKNNIVRPLNGIMTNSFCAGGGWLSNGTMVNIGGNPPVESGGTASPDGLQGIRLLDCKDEATCDVYENPQRTRLDSQRWYPSGCRLSDGSLIIIGGAIAGDWTNNDVINNPTFEFFPPKNIHGHNGTSIHSPFMVDSMPHNLFPHVLAMPDGENIFVAANNMAMLFNWKTNTEVRLPNLPNGQRCTYPYSATAVLLPLVPEKLYAPEVLICGGSHQSTANPTELSTTTPASSQCSRMVLTADGIKKGWQVESMPVPRIMPNGVLMPDGKVFIVNGATGGTAGYGNVQNQVGQSNADGPVLQPVIYDPNAPAGKRFSSKGLPTSDIPRLYHSTATMIPNGGIMVAGSNPNLDVSNAKYPTEYRVEIFSPPSVLNLVGLILALVGDVLHYNSPMMAKLQLPAKLQKRSISELGPPSCSLMDFGFSTHGVQMDQRMVVPTATISAPMRRLALLDSIPISIMGPPSENVFSRAPGWVVCQIGGVYSKMVPVFVGGKQPPPVDQGANQNLLDQITKS